jgi:RimJ/RimL family protein N-acetyltransferase
MKHTPLFESEHLRLTPIDPEKDAQAVASWTYELEIAARLREEQPARPMAAFEVKKLYERWQKDADETNRQFLFAIRLRNEHADTTPKDTSPATDPVDNKTQSDIIGVVRIKHIEWVHGAAFLDLVLGEPTNWQNFAREALDLALRFAFDELSLFRVTAVIAEHNRPANDLFEQANFTLEVRQRHSVYWNKRTWDKLYFGLLRPEWKMQQLAGVGA